MKKLEPMLRNRWNIAIASGQKRLSRVAKLAIVSGTQMMPIAAPCSMLLATAPAC